MSRLVLCRIRNETRHHSLNCDAHLLYNRTHCCPNIRGWSDANMLKLWEKIEILGRSRFQLGTEKRHTDAALRPQGCRHALRSLCLCPTYAAPAVDDVSSLCGALRRRAPGQAVLVPRSISVPRICAADLAREPTRY